METEPCDCWKNFDETGRHNYRDCGCDCHKPLTKVEYRDYRTSLVCKLFHRVSDQIMRVVGDTPYPNICYRCEPDLYVTEPISRMGRRNI